MSACETKTPVAAGNTGWLVCPDPNEHAYPDAQVDEVVFAYNQRVQGWWPASCRAATTLIDPDCASRTAHRSPVLMFFEPETHALQFFKGIGVMPFTDDLMDRFSFYFKFSRHSDDFSFAMQCASALQSDPSELDNILTRLAMRAPRLDLDVYVMNWARGVEDAAVHATKRVRVSKDTPSDQSSDDYISVSRAIEFIDLGDDDDDDDDDDGGINDSVDVASSGPAPVFEQADVVVSSANKNLSIFSEQGLPQPLHLAFDGPLRETWKTFQQALDFAERVAAQASRLSLGDVQATHEYHLFRNDKIALTNLVGTIGGPATQEQTEVLIDAASAWCNEPGRSRNRKFCFGVVYPRLYACVLADLSGCSRSAAQELVYVSAIPASEIEACAKALLA